MADKPTFLHCRMKPEYLATLDELVAHHEQDDRSSMIRLMIKDYRERMNRIKAKRAKEKTE